MKHCIHGCQTGRKQQSTRDETRMTFITLIRCCLCLGQAQIFSILQQRFVIVCDYYVFININLMKVSVFAINLYPRSVFVVRKI